MVVAHPKANPLVELATYTHMGINKYLRCGTGGDPPLKPEHAIELDGARHIVRRQRDGAYALDHHGIAHRQSAPWVRFPQAKAPKICWAMRLRTVIMAASPYGNAERHRIAKSKTRYGCCG